MHPRLAGAVLLSAALLPGAAGAIDDALVTDRPDFTESTSTIARGRIQLEGGVTWTDLEVAEELTLGELLVRFGVGDDLEFRLGVNSYVHTDLPGRRDVSGFEDMSLGVKLRLSDPQVAETSRQPQVAVIVGTSVPTGSDELRQSKLQPGVVLAFSWELPGASLGANLGYASLVEDRDRFAELSGSVALGRGLSERASAFIEYFAIVPEGSGRPNDHFVNGGFTWLIDADTQLDLRVGTGLNREAPDLFVGAGAAWRW